MRPPLKRRIPTLLTSILILAATSACGGADEAPTLVIAGIPDQDFTLLEERFGGMADLLAEELGVDVRYVPASDYAALVTAFEHGDVLLGWFGGLTGVQAQRAVPGARALVHRPADASFRSAFVAGAEVEGETLADLAGRTLTFGSESSTSGHLMPRYFLMEAGIQPEEDLAAVNYSGSHDATWQLVEDGVWEVGALNNTVWQRAVREGQVDTTAVRVLAVSPAYFDYPWVAHPALDERFGAGTMDRIAGYMVGMGGSDQERRVLSLFETEAFVTTRNENYEAIEAVAAELGLLGES